MTKRGYATWLGLLLAGAMACGGGGETESGEGGDESSGGEHADLSAFEGPVTGDSAAGEPVFANFCAGCHPGGGAGVGPDLHNRTDSPAEIRAIIRHGEDRMPGFGADQISDEDLENVLAYLTTFGMFQ
ncbi:MAG: cytochrome c [Sandaracinus sp.]|nr:cytochrome c [Sandaracinus sp.]MCB9610844.1 cytochrome c [Sandaracinus sp.]MCB9633931.1 cytochrome c [Sandaracinus sp.]